ncbi:MAG: small, acid-soluble spore protein, alpha/beta type [Veillonellaceae bacterium]|jgi:small acid-soluble spore protein F (minor alpha/beta-type SASP)|nr:small, acid-soluble spore protein, alpha/beta type [Veillonellaceae bacterium]
MSSRKGIMSDKLKYEIAKDLGFSEKLDDGDWGDVTTREAGLLVREAIKRAENAMAAENGRAHQNAD